jgi:hypothetical protein
MLSLHTRKNLLCRSWNLRSMDVDNFPAVADPVQDDGAPVQQARAILQMERCDDDVSKALDVKILGLQVHVRGLFSTSTNLRENLLEISLKFGAPVRTTRETARIEHRSIVRKRVPKLLPVEVIKRSDKGLEGCLRAKIRRLRAHCPRGSGCAEQENEKEDSSHKPLGLQRPRFPFQVSAYISPRRDSAPLLDVNLVGAHEVGHC